MWKKRGSALRKKRKRVEVEKRERKEKLQDLKRVRELKKKRKKEEFEGCKCEDFFFCIFDFFFGYLSSHVKVFHYVTFLFSFVNGTLFKVLNFFFL